VKLLLQKRSGIFIITVLLSFFAGCAPAPRGGEPLEAINQSLDAPPAEQPAAQTAPPQPPAEVRSALIPAVGQIESGYGAPKVARFDIAATEVPAREFFMGLVEGSSDNMVVHPDVSGNISIDLKNTSVAEVLEVIRNVHGYPYVKTGNIYQVMPVGLQARTFQVNYLNLVRTGKSQTRVSSGQVSEIEDNDSDSNSNDSTRGQTQTVSGSSIETASLADFWTELRGAIQSLVGSEGGRKVVVQPQASVVVVVAMPDELQMVENYLQTIQNNLQRQVVIEAKVIEVGLSDGFQSGINWVAMASDSDGKGVLGGQVGGGRIFSEGTASATDGNVLEELPDGLESLVFGGVFGMALNFNDFRAFIELLERQGDVQVLSSPRISTVNNQKAVIKVGSDEFFVTDISTDTTTGTTTNSSTDITLTPFFSGIALDVTPQIDDQGQITLHIHPTISEVQDQTKQINLFGSEQSLPLAYSTVRETDSVVHARSGQLVVIGGLMKEDIIDEDAGVPVLSNLPGIGALFRHTRSRSRKSELVILLKPQVIQSPGDWKQMLEASQQRINSIAPEFQRNWMGQ